jgi:hypothetical protein
LYFVDLSHYRYLGEKENALNVGWLDPSHEFTKGDVPEGFLNRLRALAKVRVQQTRGFHACPFCPDLRSLFTTDQWVERDRVLYETCLNDGRLSTAEIRVIAANGTVYASPSMLIHYVDCHGYLPPKEFVDAVMQTRFEE